MKTHSNGGAYWTGALNRIITDTCFGFVSWRNLRCSNQRQTKNTVIKLIPVLSAGVEDSHGILILEEFYRGKDFYFKLLSFLHMSIHCISEL